MKAKVLLTHAFLVLGISIGHSRAEDKSTNVSEEDFSSEEDFARKIERENITDVKELIRKAKHLLDELETPSKYVPNAVPVVRGFINNSTDIITLRKSLNETKDSPKNRLCLDYLNQRIEWYVTEKAAEAQKYCEADLLLSRNVVSSAYQVLLTVKRDMRRDPCTYTENCEDVRRKCDKRRQDVRTSKHSIQNIETELANLDEYYTKYQGIYYYWNSVKVNSNIDIVPQVENCMGVNN